jgi:hypothetical protein
MESEPVSGLLLNFDRVLRECRLKVVWKSDQPLILYDSRHCIRWIACFPSIDAPRLGRLDKMDNQENEGIIREMNVRRH